MICSDKGTFFDTVEVAWPTSWLWFIDIQILHCMFTSSLACVNISVVFYIIQQHKEHVFIISYKSYVCLLIWFKHKYLQTISFPSFENLTLATDMYNMLHYKRTTSMLKWCWECWPNNFHCSVVILNVGTGKIFSIVFQNKI